MGYLLDSFICDRKFILNVSLHFLKLLFVYILYLRTVMVKSISI